MIKRDHYIIDFYDLIASIHFIKSYSKSSVIVLFRCKRMKSFFGHHRPQLYYEKGKMSAIYCVRPRRYIKTLIFNFTTSNVCHCLSYFSSTINMTEIKKRDRIFFF